MRSLTNLEDVRIHDLRHTFASLAIKQGVDQYTVSKLLGQKHSHDDTLCTLRDEATLKGNECC
ncbi:MAG: hypothetical protein K2Y18_00455 [Alphaproteobacteria bacterium]|nr:hypothetical protein [Alphaproteobacteria bacterium]